MANYLFIYYGGKRPEKPKLVEKSMAGWSRWFGGLGTAVANAGTATEAGRIVDGSGTRSAGARPGTGYSIFKADVQDVAVAVARSSPIVMDDG